MASTVLVLVLMLICRLLGLLLVMVATSLLAKRSGQAVKSMSWSLRHGYTAEFFEPKDIRADN